MRLRVEVNKNYLDNRKNILQLTVLHNPLRMKISHSRKRTKSETRERIEAERVRSMGAHVRLMDG